MATQMSEEELHSLPVTVDLETAGRALGMCRSKAYRLHRDGRFPVRVDQVGRRLTVPKRILMEKLGYAA